MNSAYMSSCTMRVGRDVYRLEVSIEATSMLGDLKVESLACGK